MFTRCLLVLSLIFVTSSASAFDLAKNVVELRLSNGMRWLLVSRPGAPVFSGVVMLKVGSAEEVPGKTGLAHMFEHMAFKGSAELGPNEVWEVMARNGASDLNAFTAKDMTAYHASLPNNRLKLWSYVMSQMVGSPVFRDFYTERSVVLEELRMSVENDPDGFVMEELVQQAFADGPYHWSTIGFKEDLEGLTDEDAAAFHHQHYVAANMVGALVGNFSLPQAKQTLEHFFGSIPAGESHADAPPSKARGGVRKKISRDAEPLVVYAYHKPTFPDPDTYTMEAITSLLCDGVSSRLELQLIREEKIARSVSCTSNFPGLRFPNVMTIAVQPLNGISFQTIEKIVHREIEKLKIQPVADAELARVLSQLESHFVYSLEDNMHLAMNLASFETLFHDWKMMISYIDHMRSITPSMIQAAAQKYLTNDRRVTIERQRGGR
ncbi:MAG: insulinase family protein [Deltaproteobacteria bacterium]|nr:insulinase family protein [Deltaproteobacteria bacterium]